MATATPTVAYLGPQGTFTEQALYQFVDSGFFGDVKDIDTLPVDSPHAALSAVASGQATHAVVAIENSVDGPVTSTFDALAVHENVHIFGETEIEIAFTIMARETIDPATIKTFATHPVARQQVAQWLKNHAPEADYVAASSNAQAAHMVKNGQVDAAAAPKRAADLLGLTTIAENVADVGGARTRFVIVSHSDTPPPATAYDRSSVIFVLPNEPGSLVSALTEFSSRGVDLTCIESRPTRQGLGTYRFHADLIGHITDPVVQEALKALYEHCTEVRFLGSWPVATQPIVPNTPTPVISRPQPAERPTAEQWLHAILETP